MQGLPAICVAAFQYRALASRLLGTALLPLAAAIESTRRVPQRC
jgi:hypothetical protein